MRGGQSLYRELFDRIYQVTWDTARFELDRIVTEIDRAYLDGKLTLREATPWRTGAAPGRGR